MRAHIAVTIFGLTVSATAFAQQQAADEPQRQLGAHAHGVGKIGIAIERRTVEIEFEAPGSDIVGFEHTAKTAEQKKAVADARALLAKPLALFKLPEAAGCKVTSARVKLVGGAHHHGHSHAHSHDAKAKDAKGQATAEPHSEFHAEYKLNCAKPELIAAIDFDYFKSFPRAEALDVSFIGGKGQQAKYKVTKDKPRLELKGTS
jgi:hypothetical protein